MLDETGEEVLGVEWDGFAAFGAEGHLALPIRCVYRPR
jgi:hypothetical protein